MHCVTSVCCITYTVPCITFPVDPETRLVPEYGYVGDDPSTVLTGKQNSLIMPISPSLFPLLLALDFVTALLYYSVAPILMHSLSLLP